MDPTFLIEQIVASSHDVRRALRGRELAARFEGALLPALAVRGLKCSPEGRTPIEYRGGGLSVGYHVDLRVTGVPLVVELKVLDGLHVDDDEQMLNRLRLGVWQRGAVNLNVMVTNRGVRSDVFDLRHLARPSAAPAVASKGRPERQPMVERQPTWTARMPLAKPGVAGRIGAARQAA
jgi:GxxExxY protein